MVTPITYLAMVFTCLQVPGDQAERGSGRALSSLSARETQRTRLPGSTANVNRGAHSSHSQKYSRRNEDGAPWLGDWSLGSITMRRPCFKWRNGAEHWEFAQVETISLLSFSSRR